MKLIIDIPKERLDSIKHFGIKQNEVSMLERALISGTPLDDVIGMIDKAYDDLDGYDPYALGEFANMVSDILDNIGKVESEVKYE